MDNSLDCPICLEQISNETLASTECNHCFHQLCIDKWLSTKYNCPCCRNTIIEHDEDDDDYDDVPPLLEYNDVYPLHEYSYLYPLPEYNHVYPLPEYNNVYPLPEYNNVYPLPEYNNVYPSLDQNNELNNSHEPFVYSIGIFDFNMHYNEDSIISSINEDNNQNLIDSDDDDIPDLINNITNETIVD